ncbi:MAG: thymidine kinase [Candidatus Woesearchaeota archaeon]
MSLEEKIPCERRRGTITGRVGPMFSGKSTEIMRLIERRQIALENKGVMEEYPILSFRPAKDDRYTDKNEIMTHSGHKLEAILFNRSSEIREYVDTLEKTPDSVYISEVIFTDSGIIDVIKDFKENGINVFYEGLNQTSEGEPFPFQDLDENGKYKDNIGTLMALSDNLMTLDAVCTSCGFGHASKTFYKHGKKDVLEVGGAEAYEARCNDCWEPNA